MPRIDASKSELLSELVRVRRVQFATREKLERVTRAFETYLRRIQAVNDEVGEVFFGRERKA